ncbi:hypothetical protein BKA61DRAFT_741190 [Leptodontidium sp. MPI-SDFR-AT-0119]|nr:hypothetical protein BKA61DRAFT_741190 [Leptodontidium sp. MPI-SDFR-AT-0119]
MLDRVGGDDIEPGTPGVAGGPAAEAENPQKARAININIKLGGRGAADEALDDREAKPEPQRMLMKVRDANGHEVSFKVKRTIVLKKLVDAFCKERGRKPDLLRFFTADGKRVTCTDAPNSLNLEDGDLIDAHEEQQGGGN